MKRATSAIVTPTTPGGGSFSPFSSPHTPLTGMRRHEHRRIAEQLAVMLGLQDFKQYARLGADVPDLDLWIGRHRKTYHNLLPLLMGGLIAQPRGRLAFTIGVVSHLLADRFTRQIQAAEELWDIAKRLGLIREVRK